MFTTFSLTVFAWIFFRAENLSHAFSYIGEIFSETLFSLPYFENGTNSFTTIHLIFFFILIEWLGRSGKYALDRLEFNLNQWLRWIFYLIIIFTIYFFNTNAKEFIYFQF